MYQTMLTTFFLKKPESNLMLFICSVVWGSASAGELARPAGGQTESPVGSLFQKQEEGPEVLFVVWLLFGAVGGPQGREGCGR